MADELASFQALLSELNELRAFKAGIMAVTEMGLGVAKVGKKRGRPAKVAKAGNGAAVTKTAKKNGKAGKKKTNAEMQCRATGCTNRSKGPRFGYLCEKHADAPPVDKNRWKKEYAAKKDKD